MSKKLKRIMLAIALGLAWQVSADTVIISDNDARVQANDPDRNYDTDLLKLYNRADKGWIAYVGFDMATVTGTVSDATFTVAQEGTKTTASTITVYGLTDAWDQDSLTWNNAPQNDTNSITGMLSGATDLGTLTWAAGGADGTTFDFSSTALTTFLNANSEAATATLVLIITDGGLSGDLYNSESTAGDGPKLTLTVESEPTKTLSLFTVQ